MFSPYGDRFCLSKICGRPMVAPTDHFLNTLKWACCKMNCNTPKKRCHPERLKKIEDFRRESKDLRTDLTANVLSVRRSFDSLRSLRMTDFGCVAKNGILQRTHFLFSVRQFARRGSKSNPPSDPHHVRSHGFYSSNDRQNVRQFARRGSRFTLFKPVPCSFSRVLLE